MRKITVHIKKDENSNQNNTLELLKKKMIGKIASYFEEKGYGFISVVNDKKQYFFHLNFHVINKSNFEELVFIHKNLKSNEVFVVKKMEILCMPKIRLQSIRRYENQMKEPVLMRVCR